MMMRVAVGGISIASWEAWREGEQKENTHRLRYESTSPIAATVWHGRSSGAGALWSDIASSDVVRVEALRTLL